MKFSKHLSALGFVLIFSVFGMVAAQDAGIKKLVDEQTFIFAAHRANPMEGTAINLSTGYDLIITKDKITAYLPYYGRAYTVPANPAEGGIKFTSTSFEYIVDSFVRGKRSSWEIKIKPKDVYTVREMNLSFFGNGTATLQVISDQRQPISYDGYIDAYKPPKEKNKSKSKIKVKETN